MPLRAFTYHSNNLFLHIFKGPFQTENKSHTNPNIKQYPKTNSCNPEKSECRLITFSRSWSGRICHQSTLSRITSSTPLHLSYQTRAVIQFHFHFGRPYQTWFRAQSPSCEAAEMPFKVLLHDIFYCANNRTTRCMDMQSQRTLERVHHFLRKHGFSHSPPIVKRWSAHHKYLLAPKPNPTRTHNSLVHLMLWERRNKKHKTRQIFKIKSTF